MYKLMLGIVSVACTIGIACPASAGASTYAPVDQTGPALDVPAAGLAQSLRCTASLPSAGRAPVLFVPPTLSNPDESYFAYEDALTAMGIPYCTVTIPDYTTIDIQVSAEYVVSAVRTMHAETHRPVQIIGWSQGGGPEPRWALRFWPDIRPMVSKLIDLEAPNHGTVVLHYTCTGSGSAEGCYSSMCPGHCVPALYQQADNAQFTAALNSDQETFPGIAYTNVYSHTSQFVQPNLNSDGSTSLHGGGGEIANIATQDICPANAADHLAYYYDPVAYAIVIDALTHDGPADPNRINPDVCTEVSNPYVPASEIPSYSAYAYDALFVNRAQQEPQVTQEPPLKCYVTASCPAASKQTSTRKPQRKRHHKPHKARPSHRPRRGAQGLTG